MTILEGQPTGKGRRFCIVVSRFNHVVTEQLEAGARTCLLDRGVSQADIDIVRVPGAWELPWAARLAGRCGYDGIVVLGCVIRGETPHFDYLCLGATQGLAALSSEIDIPVGFGLLTTNDLEQALQRVGGTHGNKGEQAALAVLEMCELKERLSDDG